MGSNRLRGALACVVLAGALWAPSSALAATKPTVTSGRATQVATTTARLNGSVNPNGAATTYLFQFGTTRLYDNRTATLSLPKGGKSRHVEVVIGGLAPATTYHYRLVAHNDQGYGFGKDRTFKTKPQPLGVSLAATPNPIRQNHSTVLAGTLSGTDSGHRLVQLQANEWPYTAGFKQVGNNQQTDATGHFSFPILSVPVNTQYRVLMPAKPKVISPIVVLGTTVKVTRHASVRPGAKRGRIHLWGHINSPQGGRIVAVLQKLRNGAWVNIKQSTAIPTNQGFERYSVRVRQKHGGRYRIVAVDGTAAHSPSISRTIRLRHLRT